MLVGQRHLDVDGGEDGEDVGLQRGDEDLEHGEDDAEGEGADAEQADEVAAGRARVTKKKLVARKQSDEQHVPGDHVHRESQGQRDRPQDEGREELEQRQDDRHRAATARPAGSARS